MACEAQYKSCKARIQLPKMVDSVINILGLNSYVPAGAPRAKDSW